MKINEILVEAGFLGAVGKGLANAVAPGAVDKLKGLNAQKGELNKQTASQAPAPEILTKAMAELHQLAAKSNNTVSLAQIAGVLLQHITPAEQAALESPNTRGPAKEKLFGEARFIGARLVKAGVDVPEIAAAQQAMSRTEKGSDATTPIVQPGDVWKWNPKTAILSVTNPETIPAKYQKNRSGKWFDYNTKEEITKDRAASLQTELDKLTGRVPVPANTPVSPTAPIQVKSADGTSVITKMPNGTWQTAAGDAIVDPTDIATLEAKAKQQAINARALALAKGTAV